MKVTVLGGDITTVQPFDAIITPINSAGYWSGGVDLAIKRIAGDQYHLQAARELMRASARDGTTIVARKLRAHSGQFENVIFVIDNFELEICDLVYMSLFMAVNQNYRRVAMPMMRRTGLVDQLSGLSMPQTAEQIKAGIKRFQQEFPKSGMEIFVVVFRNPETLQLLNDVFDS